jgi:Carboxypeptidase regulatory-like domain
MPLLIAFLLVQNIAISGTLKDADGKSLTGVRVAAMPVAGNFLVGTTNTDKDGRYTLELPPGAYYVVAGNVFWPTYYTANGSRVVISTSRNGVDFVVNAASLRPLLRREELPPRSIQWDVPPTPPKFPPWPR